MEPVLVKSFNSATEPTHLTSKHIPYGRTFTVGSWDGGGTRGIIPAVIMQKISEMSNLEPYEFLNMGIGTSTGGLICTAYLGKKEGQPIIKAAQLPAFWEENVTKIFHQTWLNEIETWDGYLHPKYREQGLINLIDQLAPERMNIKDDFFCPVIYSAVDATIKKSFYFKSVDVENSIDKKIYEVSNVLRCTTAAPGYFSPVSVPINGTEHAFVDGGLSCNNPALIGYLEAQKLARPQDKIKVLSFGTGRVENESDSYAHLSNAGFLNYPGIILNLFFGSMEDTPNHILDKDVYKRFQVDIESKYGRLDDVSSVSILKEKAHKWIDEHVDEIEQLASTLKSNDSNELYAQPNEVY